MSSFSVIRFPASIDVLHCLLAVLRDLDHREIELVD
jgi:hypothetical protein